MVKLNTKSGFCHGSQSPDLWADLKRRVHTRGPQTLDDLERLCEEEFGFLLLYFTILFDVMGEDSVLFFLAL